MKKIVWLRYAIGGTCVLGLVIFSFTMVRLYRDATRTDVMMDKLDRAGLQMELSKKDVELAELKVRLALMKAGGKPQDATGTTTPLTLPVMPPAILPERTRFIRLNRAEREALPTGELIKHFQDAGSDIERESLFMEISFRKDLSIDFLLEHLRTVPDPIPRGGAIANNLVLAIKALERRDLAEPHPLRPEVLPFMASRDRDVRRAARTYLFTVGGEAMLDRWFQEIRNLQAQGTESALAELSDTATDALSCGNRLFERVRLHREYPLVGGIDQDSALKRQNELYAGKDTIDAVTRLEAYRTAGTAFARGGLLGEYARNPGSDPAKIRELLRQEMAQSKSFYSPIAAGVLGLRESSGEIPDDVLLWLNDAEFTKRKTATAYLIGRGDAKAAEQLLLHLEKLAANPKDLAKADDLRDQWGQIHDNRWMTLLMEKCRDGKVRMARMRAIDATPIVTRP